MGWQWRALRRTFNAAVTDYNNTIEMFPSCIVARSRHHCAEELIEIPDQEQRNVNVADLFKK